jgi:hypothetical protein
MDTIENATAKTANRRSTRGKRPKSSTSDLPGDDARMRAAPD